MIFLALLIAVSIWSTWPKLTSVLQNDSGFRWLYNVLGKIFPVSVAVSLSVIFPVVVILAVMVVVQRQVFDIFTLLFSVIFILYGLGRGDLRPRWFNYLEELQRGDYEASYRQAVDMGVIVSEEAIEDSFALHDRMRRFFAYSSLERCFAPVFWYVLLGPAAIVAYRLITVASQWRGDELSVVSNLSMRWRIWLEYIPARLLALTFALAGNFSTAFSYIQDRLFNRDAPDLVVGGTAIASLELPFSAIEYAEQPDLVQAPFQEMLDIKNLLRRSQFVWLIALGFMLLI